ncbi:MAG: TetR/AcrR family transcriptional regulator [Treponema sp.]|nr:TetR/AcrR family transcriptional regulator [Treponema sp.]
MSSVTESRVERKRQEARQRLLAAARELFVVEGGFESATIRDIAQRADVSVGAVYLHFKTKVDIVEALVNERVAEIIESAKAAIACVQSGRQKFEALMDGFSQMSLDTEMRLFAQILFLQRRSGRLLDYPDNLLSSNLSSIIDLIAEAFKAGGSDGSLAIAENPRLLATIIFQCVFGVSVFDFFLSEQGNEGIGSSTGYSALEITSSFKRFLLNALVTPPSRADD